MDNEELQRRLDRQDEPESIIRWLTEDQGVPEGSARLMVTVEVAQRDGDDLETVFP